MRIKMTSIYVDDPHQAHLFYTNVLGFLEVMYVPEEDLAIVASAEDPDGTALLLEPKDTPFSRAYQKELYDLGMPSIVLCVDDITFESKRLKGLGVTFSVNPSPQDFGIQAIFDDTCGNFIALVELKA